jgi:hypothetical protein
MATLDSVSIGTPGAATAQTVTTTAGPKQQVFRPAMATAATDTAWTIATTAAVVIAADTTATGRVGVWIYNASTNATVYLSVAAAGPTTALYSFQPLPPGASIDLPSWAVNLNVRMLGSVATGTVLYTLGTHA